MAKLIKTTTGLTTVDGGILDIGAVIKFSVEFLVSIKGYRMRLYFYRNQEFYDQGFEPIRMKDFNEEYTIILSDAELEALTYSQMIIKASGHVNAGFGTIVCEIITV